MSRYLAIFLLFVVSAAYCETYTTPDSLQTTIQDRWFAPDKAHHFITSAYLAALGNYVAKEEFSFSSHSSKRVAVGFSFSLGLFKEIYDGTIRKRYFSYKDLVADCAGITIGLIILNNVE